MIVSTVELEVRYYETDLMGIVHHSNHVRYFECGSNFPFDVFSAVFPISVMVSTFASHSRCPGSNPGTVLVGIFSELKSAIEHGRLLKHFNEANLPRAIK